jgi:hypothetical protein
VVDEPGPALESVLARELVLRAVERDPTIALARLRLLAQVLERWTLR